MTFLDVGQGDASLLELPGGKTMLIDAGGLVGSPVDVGRLVIAPALSARRIRQVDIFVLTHPHSGAHSFELAGGVSGAHHLRPAAQ